MKHTPESVLNDEEWRINVVMILDVLVKQVANEMPSFQIERSSMERSLAKLWADLEARNDAALTPENKE